MASEQNVTREEEEGLSMVDVLEEEHELEADANAVLGDSDEKNCTYLMGYVPRQAIYACATCTTSDMDPAGICLACSYECHEGHDLYELYTKRHFRCDCGNKKFPGMRCKFNPRKDEENIENKYGQNFHGKYCICNRPYPDPDDEVEDEMLQCIVCEDWLHGRHLGNSVPTSESYSEMICGPCMKNCDFLWSYVPVKEVTDESNGKSESSTEIKKEEDVDVVTETKDVKLHSPEKDTTICKLKLLQGKGPTSVSKGGATFWQTCWRATLCSCADCKVMYKEKNVEFILNEADSIHAYEERGRAKQPSTSNQYDQGMQALAGMHRTQQIEVVSGYNDLKSELKDYLKKFAENGKMVREEDIKEFFTQLSANKRRKQGLQYHCK